MQHQHTTKGEKSKSNLNLELPLDHLQMYQYK
jgi:hypothetical protein